MIPSSSESQLIDHQLALVAAAPHDQIFHLFQPLQMLPQLRVAPACVYSRTVRRVKR
jgi:hypothetical protein